MELVACAVVGGTLVFTGLASSEFGEHYKILLCCKCRADTSRATRRQLRKAGFEAGEQERFSSD